MPPIKVPPSTVNCEASPVRVIVRVSDPSVSVTSALVIIEESSILCPLPSTIASEVLGSTVVIEAGSATPRKSTDIGRIAGREVLV